jgi:hypothetical protein
MQRPDQLPNIYAVLTALWLLFLPVLMTFVARKLRSGLGSRVQAAEVAVRES